MKKKQLFTVSDGDLVLELEPADEGGYLVRSPLDPQLVTEAETLEEAFENARDAREALGKARAKLKKLLETSGSKRIGKAHESPGSRKASANCWGFHFLRGFDQ